MNNILVIKKNNMIQLAKDTIDKKDLNALADWILTYPKLTKGDLTLQYEYEYSKKCGREYSVFVNSGSSANLLMIYSLIESKRLKNKKVIIPSLCWITTISPSIQFGLQPILCDINMGNLSVDLNELEKIFKKEKPSLLFLVSILGLIPDIYNIYYLCDKYGVILIMDNCESQGSSIHGKSLESFGLMSSCSSYFGHITSTIEGGMITTDDTNLYNKLKMLRSHGWDRDLDSFTQSELKRKYKVNDFNSLYTFYTTGFNVRSSDLNAFIGLKQLEKLGLFIKKRNENFDIYNKLIKNNYWKPSFLGQFTRKNCVISNLGYPIIHPKRDVIIKELRKSNVEVRPLISGSMGTQPFWIEKYGKQILPNASIVDKWGFYVPNHAQLTKKEIQFICKIINKYN